MRNFLLLLLLTVPSLSGCATTKVPVAVAVPCRVIPPPPAALMSPPLSPQALTTLSQRLSKQQDTTPTR